MVVVVVVVMEVMVMWRQIHLRGGRQSWILTSRQPLEITPEKQTERERERERGRELTSGSEWVIAK